MTPDVTSEQADPTESPWLPMAGVVGGVALLLTATVVGLAALKLPQRPSGRVPLIGVAASLPDGPLSRGIHARLYVQSDGCRDTVPVALLVTADSSVWRAQPPSRTDRAVVRHPRRRPPHSNGYVAIAISAAEVTAPPTLAFAAVEEQIGKLETTPRKGGHYPDPALLRSRGFRAARGFWLASAQLGAWRATHAALVIRFHARWTTDRSAGTCYLRMPSMTGAGPYYADLAAEQELRHDTPRKALGGGLAGPLTHNPVVAASAAINPGAATLDAAASTPAPNLIKGAEIGWRCQVPRMGPGTVGTSIGRFRLYDAPRAGPPPQPAPLAGTLPDDDQGCAAVAVIASGGRRRDASLLISGVLAPFGVTFAFGGLHQLLRRWRRRRWRTRCDGDA
jgi:hypothetical protein